MDAVRSLFHQFEETFEHYGRTCARPNNMSIVHHLQKLRNQLKCDLGAIVTTFVGVLGREPNLARLNDAKYDYVCFGDLHGSLTDLIYLRQSYWRDLAQLDKMHFVFLGEYP